MALAALVNGGAQTMDVLPASSEGVQRDVKPVAPPPSEQCSTFCHPQEPCTITEDGKCDAKPKGGPLSQWLALRCKEPEFQQWVARLTESTDEMIVANWCREQCGVASRAEIDTKAGAGDLFHKHIRQPYNRWLATRGKTQVRD
jgi:hypothetical protein